MTRRNADAQRREWERAAGQGDDNALGRLVEDRRRKGDLTLDFLLQWRRRVNQFLTDEQLEGMRRMLAVQGDPVITVVGEGGEVGVYQEDGFVRWVWEVFQEHRDDAPELSVDEAIELASGFNHEVTRVVPTIYRISTDEGLDVSAFRGDDGVMVVDVDPSGLEEADTYPPHDIPRLRVVINEEVNTTSPDGGWVEHGAHGPIVISREEAELAVMYLEGNGDVFNDTEAAEVAARIQAGIETHAEGVQAGIEIDEEEQLDVAGLVQEILEEIESDNQITEIVDTYTNTMTEAQFLAVLRELGDRNLGIVPPDLSSGWDSALRQLAFNALEAVVGERWSAQEEDRREQQADNWARHPDREMRDQADEHEDEDE